MSSKVQRSADIALPAAERNGLRAFFKPLALGSPAVWPLHPFLFAAATIFAPYAGNLREVVFGDVVTPLVVVLVTALVLYLAAAALLRTFGPPAAILATILLIAGLHYVDLADRASGWSAGAINSGNAVPLVLGAAGILMLAVGLLRPNLTLPNAILNGIALVLFITPTWKVGHYIWNTLPQPQTNPPAAVSTITGRELPDIYYFIFDRYASEGTLQREFGFDNAPTLDFLRERGFFVASDSRSNYLKTAPSLAATFNMDYINGLHGDPHTKRGDWLPIYHMLDDHRVGRIVKAHGYDFIQVGAWWGPTQHNRLADEEYTFGFSEFSWLYLRRTIIPYLASAALPNNDWSKILDWDNAQCRRVPLQFAKVKEIGERRGPTFTFAHVLLPHEPFVFRADGSCRSALETQRISFDRGYLAQVEYANTLIRDVVTSLLDTDGPRPVIIIQADEGPFPERFRTGGRPWTEATKRELQMKTGILNAIYLPDGDYTGFRQDMTSVNTFRLVFDRIFDTTYGRLPDHIYAVRDVFHLYDFYDITAAAPPQPRTPYSR